MFFLGMTEKGVVLAMNPAWEVQTVATLSLLKSRYRQRKPKEKGTATGVISVVVIVPSVIATATCVVIASATGVVIASASGVITSTRVVTNSVCLTRRYSAYC
jgi:hypothetical protein